VQIYRATRSAAPAYSLLATRSRFEIPYLRKAVIVPNKVCLAMRETVTAERNYRFRISLRVKVHTLLPTEKWPIGVYPRNSWVMLQALIDIW